MARGAVVDCLDEAAAAEEGSGAPLEVEQRTGPRVHCLDWAATGPHCPVLVVRIVRPARRATLIPTSSNVSVGSISVITVAEVGESRGPRSQRTEGCHSRPAIHGITKGGLKHF